MKRLEGGVAVVTGAARGIGRALSLALGRAGMDVALADVDAPALATVADEVRALGRRALPLPTDVRDPAAVQRLRDDTLHGLGDCHLLANNAGVFHGAALIDTPDAEWDRVLDINLRGVVHGCRAFAPWFASRGQGHIVNTASAAGLFPVPGMGAYSASKFAVVGLSWQLRWELADKGVGVTVLCPGVVNTDIARAAGTGLEHLDLREVTDRAPSPDALAEKTIRAVRKNRPLVLYGRDAYAFGLLRLLPARIFDRLGIYLAGQALRAIATPPATETTQGDSSRNRTRPLSRS